MNNKTKFLVVISLMFFGVFARLIPHVPNFTPTEGLAIFGIAMLRRKWLVLMLTLFMLYLSDFMLNNTILRAFFPNESGTIWYSDYMLYNFIALTVIIVMSTIIFKKSKSWPNILAAGVLSAVIFFLISNFGVWASPVSMYPKSFNGLIACYISAVPFFHYSLLSTLLFLGFLFGSYQIIEKIGQTAFKTA